MSYRPYPSTDRALHQVDRHAPTAPPRQPTALEQRMGEQARTALAAMAEVMRPMLEDFAKQAQRAAQTRKPSMALQMAMGPGPRDTQRGYDDGFSAGRVAGYRDGARPGR